MTLKHPWVTNDAKLFGETLAEDDNFILKEHSSHLSDAGAVYFKNVYWRRSDVEWNDLLIKERGLALKRYEALKLQRDFLLAVLIPFLIVGFVGLVYVVIDILELMK